MTKWTLLILPMLLFLCGGINATSTSILPVEPQDLRAECEKFLEPSFFGSNCQTALEQPVNLKREKKKELARRVSKIFRSAVSDLFWKSDETSSLARQKWRSFTIDALEFSTYAKLLGDVDRPKQGLTRENAELLVRLFGTTENFLQDFLKQPQAMSKRASKELRAPFFDIVKDEVVDPFTPPEELLRLQLDSLSTDIVDWTARTFLTPESITKLLLAIRFPYDVETGKLDHKVVERMKREHPKLCKELGQSLLRSLSLVSSHSLTGLRKGAANISMLVLKAYDKELGAFVFAAIDDVLTSDESLAVPMIERLIESLSKETVLPTAAESAQLKADLEQSIDRDLSAFMQYLIHADAKKSRLLKSLVPGFIEQMKPMLVGLVWNKEARVAEHLLFHYFPPLFRTVTETSAKKNMRVLSPQKVKRAQDIGILSADIVGAYLWPDVGTPSEIRPLFVNSVGAGATQIAYNMLDHDGKSNPNETAMRAARTLTMLHMFLEDFRTGSYRAANAQEDPIKPFREIVDEIAASKFPHDVDEQMRFTKLTLEGVDVFFDTVLDPRILSNLLIRFDFPSRVDKTVQTTTQSKDESIVEAMPDAWTHKHFGKAFVRVVRSFLRLGGELGVVKSSLIGVANYFHESIGANILTGESSDSMPGFRKLFFTQGGVQGERARLTIDWIEDEATLRQEIRRWVKDKMMVYLQGEVEEFAPWGTQWLINSEVNALVPALAERVESLVWEPRQKSLKILFFHYLLPIWRHDILAAFQQDGSCMLPQPSESI